MWEAVNIYVESSQQPGCLTPFYFYAYWRTAVWESLLQAIDDQSLYLPEETTHVTDGEILIWLITISYFFSCTLKNLHTWLIQQFVYLAELNGNALISLENLQ